MPGIKTNERPGTRAVLRHCRMSATKARVVLNLIRGQDVDRAAEILQGTPREAAEIVGKLLASAVANAVHNDGADAEELYVSSCYADEGVTLKRWRPRARGRATRIRKRSCHITVIVSRMPEERLIRRRAQRQAAGALRQRRVAESRRRADLAGRLSRRRHVAEAEAEAEAALPAESPQVNLEAPAELEAPEEPEEDRAEEDGDEEGGADGGPTDESEKGE
ncbi:MAG: 50S ribosomal protein L22 [Actinomycetota bacterium]|nr:50S ribosomal protein L22 [Actinomycetota bacterium]